MHVYYCPSCEQFYLYFYYCTWLRLSNLYIKENGGGGGGG